MADPAGLPLRLADRPVFAEPWEATVFALALHLHEQAVFAWPEFAGELAARLAASPSATEPSATYYEHWLVAVEVLVVRHGIATDADLDDMTDAWHEAADHTPHGQPILLHGTRER